MLKYWCLLTAVLRCIALLCLVLSCLAVPCRAVPCRAVPCRAVPCCHRNSGYFCALQLWSTVQCSNDLVMYAVVLSSLVLGCVAFWCDVICIAVLSFVCVVDLRTLCSSFLDCVIKMSKSVSPITFNKLSWG